MPCALSTKIQPDSRGTRPGIHTETLRSLRKIGGGFYYVDACADFVRHFRRVAVRELDTNSMTLLTPGLFVVAARCLNVGKDRATAPSSICVWRAEQMVKSPMRAIAMRRPFAM